MHPNRHQWWVIWLTVVPALLLWVSSGPHIETERLALALLSVGALVVWRLSPPGHRQRYRSDDSSDTLAEVERHLASISATVDAICERLPSPPPTEQELRAAEREKAEDRKYAEAYSSCLNAGGTKREAYVAACRAVGTEPHPPSGR